MESVLSVAHIGHHTNDTTLISLVTYDLYTFLLTLLEKSEVVARKSSIKKVFLKIPQNLQENVGSRVSFCNKALGWPAT